MCHFFWPSFQTPLKNLSQRVGGAKPEASVLIFEGGYKLGNLMIVISTDMMNTEIFIKNQSFVWFQSKFVNYQDQSKV